MQIKTLEDAQQVLLSNDHNEQQLCELGQILHNSKATFAAQSAYNKAFYLNPLNDQTLANYLSFLTSISMHRFALDFLIHAHCDIHPTPERAKWICQLISQLPNDQDWQKRIEKIVDLNEIEFKKLVDLETFCFEQDIQYHEIEKVKLINIPEINANLPFYQKKMAGAYKQPPVAFAIVPNVQVTEKSFACFHSEFAIRAEYNYPNRDHFILNNSAEEYLVYLPEFRASTDKGLVKTVRTTRKIPGLCLSLLTPNNQNYYHFFYELFSKVKLLEEIKLNAPLKLIISEDLPEQFKQIFKFYNINYSLEIIKKGEVIELEKSIIIDGLGLTPCDLSPNVNPILSDCYISDKTVSMLALKEKNIVKNKRRIYISRAKGSGGRAEVNEPEVAILAEEMGFEVIYPEQYTFEQQVQLFKEAEVIWGFVGAAFTNIIFSSPGTKLIAIAPYEGNIVDYSIFSKLAHFCHIDLNYFLTRNLAANHAYKNFCARSVNIPELKSYVESIIKKEHNHDHKKS